MSLSSEGFFNIRLIRATFILQGIMPVSRDKLTNLLSEGIRGRYTSLKTAAGIGSSGQDFMGAFLMILSMSSSVVWVNDRRRFQCSGSGMVWCPVSSMLVRCW